MAGGSSIALPEDVAKAREQEHAAEAAAQQQKLAGAVMTMQNRGTLAKELFRDFCRIAVEKGIEHPPEDAERCGAYQAYRDVFEPLARAAVDAADIFLVEIGMVKSAGVAKDLASRTSLAIGTEPLPLPAAS